MVKIFFLTFVFLSTIVAINHPLTSNIEVDGSSSDWDHLQVGAAATSGSAFNQVSLSSLGLVPINFNDASAWTFCDNLGSSAQGFASTANHFTNALTVSGSVNLNSGSLSYSCFDTFGKLASAQLVAGVVKSSTGSFSFTTLLLEATSGHFTIQTLGSLTGSVSWTVSVPTQDFSSSPLTSGSAYVSPTFSGSLAFVTFAPAAVHSSNGITFLRGQFGVATSATAQTVFQLPSGTAPAADTSFVVICENDVATTVTITSSGSVTYTGAAHNWCSLDGISFVNPSVSSLSGQSSSGFNAYFSSLYRDRDDATRGRPSLALTKYWALHFVGTAADGTGAEVASFESSQYPLSTKTQTLYFPVATSQGVQVLQNTLSSQASVFSLTSSPSATPSGFTRVFAANTPSSGSFALLVESGNLASITSVNFSFSTGAQATYDITQSAWTSATKFTRYSAAGSGNTFELSFSDATQTAAGNSVQVSVGATTFTYNF